MVAGPSEVVVVADAGAAPAAWLAADLLAQAEHDALAQSVLVTDDLSFADEVAAAVADQLSRLPRGGIAAASWAGQGAVIVVPAIGEETAALVDALAPEHLQLVGPRAEALEGRIRHAGSVFLGAHTPEVIGDYVGGPNHVLPTGRTARFASGLAVHDFLKRTTILGCTPEAFARLGPAAATLARAEGPGRARPRGGAQARGGAAVSGGRCGAGAGRGRVRAVASRIASLEIDQRSSRPLDCRGRARAQRRDLRPAGGNSSASPTSRALPVVLLAAREQPDLGRDGPSKGLSGPRSCWARGPFRSVVKDYFLICDSYFKAIRRHAQPDRGDRHGAARAAQRGVGPPARGARRPG
jgi:hypothetical protein